MRRLRWDQIEGGRIVLADSKTGPKTVWLGKRNRAVIAKLPQVSPFVFFHKRTAISETVLYQLWNVVRTDLGQPTLRLHDLRHSFAAKGLRSNIGLRTLGGLLGHSEIETTAHYARLDPVEIQSAAERVAVHLNAALTAKVSPRKPRASQ